MTPYHFLIIDHIPFEAHQNIIAMSEEAELEEDEGSGRRRGIKTLRDVQKSQLEKLMANPVSTHGFAMVMQFSWMSWQVWFVSTVGQGSAYPRASQGLEAKRCTWICPFLHGWGFIVSFLGQLANTAPQISIMCYRDRVWVTGTPMIENFRSVILNVLTGWSSFFP